MDKAESTKHKVSGHASSLKDTRDLELRESTCSNRAACDIFLSNKMQTRPIDRSYASNNDTR